MKQKNDLLLERIEILQKKIKDNNMADNSKMNIKEEKEDSSDGELNLE